MMGLVPEFFVLLGIIIFLAMSLLSALLDNNLPSPLQYIFQIAAIAGLGELLMSQGFAGTTRLWISIVYLTFALSGVVGLDAYLATLHKRTDIAATFSEMVVVPILIVSAFFVYSFLGSSGEVNLSPVAISALSGFIFVTSISVYGFQREASRHISKTPGRLRSSPIDPMPTPLSLPEIDWLLSLPSILGEDQQISDAEWVRHNI
jgi:hypothetical protein